MGLLQFFGGVLAGVCTMIYLASRDDPIDIIIRTMALCIIADVDGIAFRNMPKENRIFWKFDPMKVTVHRNDFKACGKGNCAKMTRTTPQKFLRLIQKTCRIFYASYFFYFLPITILFIPPIANKFNWLNI